MTDATVRSLKAKKKAGNISFSESEALDIALAMRSVVSSSQEMRVVTVTIYDPRVARAIISR